MTSYGNWSQSKHHPTLADTISTCAILGHYEPIIALSYRVMGALQTCQKSILTRIVQYYMWTDRERQVWCACIWTEIGIDLIGDVFFLSCGQWRWTLTTWHGIWSVVESWLEMQQRGRILRFCSLTLHHKRLCDRKEYTRLIREPIYITWHLTNRPIVICFSLRLVMLPNLVVLRQIVWTCTKGGDLSFWDSAPMGGVWWT